MTEVVLEARASGEEPGIPFAASTADSGTNVENVGESASTNDAESAPEARESPSLDMPTEPSEGSVLSETSEGGVEIETASKARAAGCTTENAGRADGVAETITTSTPTRNA